MMYLQIWKVSSPVKKEQHTLAASAIKNSEELAAFVALQNKLPGVGGGGGGGGVRLLLKFIDW
jgi:hypothetical protein